MTSFLRHYHITRSMESADGHSMGVPGELTIVASSQLTDKPITRYKRSNLQSVLLQTAIAMIVAAVMIVVVVMINAIVIIVIFVVIVISMNHGP